MTDNSENQPSNTFAVLLMMSPLLVIAVGLIGWVISLAIDKPNTDRILALQEKACADLNMVRLKDKYHGPVCAFYLDDNGNRKQGE